MRRLAIFAALAAATFFLAHRRIEADRRAAAAEIEVRTIVIRRLEAEKSSLTAERARLESPPAEAAVQPGEPVVATRAEATRLLDDIRRLGGFTVVAKPQAFRLTADGKLPPEFKSLFRLGEAEFGALQSRVSGIKEAIDRAVAANASVRTGPAGGTIIEVRGDPATAGLRDQLDTAVRQSLSPDDYDLYAALQKNGDASQIIQDRRRLVEYFGDTPRTFTVTRNPVPRGYNLTIGDGIAPYLFRELDRPELERTLGPLAALLPPTMFTP